jgi:hypothetical protein
MFTEYIGQALLLLWLILINRLRCVNFKPNVLHFHQTLIQSTTQLIPRGSQSE